jgi:hypothetical protein
VRTLIFIVLGAALGLVIVAFVFLRGANLKSPESAGYLVGALIGGSVGGAILSKLNSR